MHSSLALIVSEGTETSIISPIFVRPTVATPERSAPPSTFFFSAAAATDSSDRPDKSYHGVLELLPLEGHAPLFPLPHLLVSLRCRREGFKVGFPEQSSVDLAYGGGHEDGMPIAAILSTRLEIKARFLWRESCQPFPERHRARCHEVSRHETPGFVFSARAYSTNRTAPCV